MSSNPFALLEDESADPVVVQKPAKVGKPAAKSAAPKPAPKTASNNSNKANPAKKTFKFVPKAGGQVDSAPFEEAPVHKEGVQTERPIHKGEARRDRHSRAGNFKDSEKKMVAGKGTWGDEMQAQIAEIDEEEELARQKEAELEQSYKSLSQFKSEQQALKLNEKVQVRKANEGADESSFKGTVLEKPQDDVFFAGKVICGNFRLPFKRSASKRRQANKCSLSSRANWCVKTAQTAPSVNTRTRKIPSVLKAPRATSPQSALKSRPRQPRNLQRVSM